jgi:Kef-type K+ transport system membrane component KefB
MNSESRRFYAVGVLAYLGLLFAGIVIVFGVLQLGNQWGMVEATPTETHAVPKSSSSVDVVFHVLLTLSAVIFLGAIFGRLCRYIGQPPVIGEVIAGLALVPSLLGAISPDAMHLLIPSQVLDPKSAVATSLKVIAQLGVILYMFLVGLELNAAQLKHKAHAAVAISHASIVVPFTLGTILSLWLYPMLSDRDVPFVSFALFLGVAMSISILSAQWSER